MSDWQERLGEAMEARAISGGELARRSGFTAQYINSLRKKGRGARLTLDTAQKLAGALGVTVEWLTRGDAAREAPRLSDVYPVGAFPPDSAPLTDRYPSRAEVIALLEGTASPEVIAALRTVVPEGAADPGRDFWIDYARELTRDLRRIQQDPDLRPGPPASEPALRSARRRAASREK